MAGIGILRASTAIGWVAAIIANLAIGADVVWAAPTPPPAPTPAPAPTSTLTLDRVLELVRQTEPGVLAARASGAAGRAEATTSSSTFSPRISLRGGAVRSDDPALLFAQKLQQGRFGIADFALQELNHPAAATGYRWGVAVEQPIWNGGAEVTARGLAKHLRTTAAAIESAAVAERLLRAVEIYVETVQSREAVGADSAALTAAEELRRAAIDRMRQGLVPELDTLRATARWAEARTALLETRSRHRVALLRLGRLLGQEVRDEEVAGFPDDPSPSDLVPRGGERWELRAAREQAEALGIESQRAGLRLLPSVNTALALDYYAAPDQGQPEHRFTADVSVDLPIWDGRRRIQERRAAKARAEQARETVIVLDRELASAAEAARHELLVSLERKEVTGQARAAAVEAERLALGRFAAGLLPLGELLSASSDASRYRAKHVEALAQVTLSQYRYLHAIGDLK